MDSELATYIAAWSHSADQVVELGRGLRQGDGARATDLPGWTVHDVFAHLAALEAVLAGEPDPAGESLAVGGREITPEYTRLGVTARHDLPTAEVVDELATHVATRRGQLQARSPGDPTERPDRSPAGLGWDWRTLLRNRAIDMWVHEQDIRRAIGRPGDLDGPGAQVTVGVFAAALPYVVGKRVAPPPGTIVTWEVAGPVGFSSTIGVGDDGRARLLDAVPRPADVTIGTDTATFAMLAAGRRAPGELAVSTNGDADLAARILESMALTP